MTEAAANKSLNQTGVNAVYAALVDTAAYVYSAAHSFYSSLGGIVAEKEITTPTVVNGLFDGDDVLFNNVPAGPPCEAIVLFRKNAGANTTWWLVVYFDTGISGLPITPNGGNIQLTFQLSGIAQL